jgi:hypothetical protein
MDKIKTALGAIMIILGIVGLVLTFSIYRFIDSSLRSNLFAVLAIYSIMFELLGIYMLYESIKMDL